MTVPDAAFEVVTPYKPNPSLNSLPKISKLSYLLGIASGISLTITLQNWHSFPAFPIYVLFISVFHFLEFYITASYQPGRVTDDSFVLDNPGYHVAHGIAILEYGIENYMFPTLKSSFNGVKLVGLSVVLTCQSIRTLAMVTAGINFSHVIKNVKENDHTLIQHGIYSIFRHPSYFGFFYWALGTQILLLNPVSFVLFMFLLYAFFSSRIPYEEAYLLKFFGEQYKEYMAKSWIGIPFIYSSFGFKEKMKIDH